MTLGLVLIGLGVIVAMAALAWILRAEVTRGRKGRRPF
jgi:hypothetical protein